MYKEPIPAYEEFCYQLGQLKPSFLFDTFSTFIEAERKETQYFTMAMIGGPDYVRTFSEWKALHLNALIDDKVHRARNEAAARLQKDILTGDDEFDDFRQKVRAHDWYYDYSNDPVVYRAGEQRQRELANIAAIKGGIFQKYWLHAQKNK